MILNSIKNNFFLYFLSLSNSINYIFYFPFILLYIFESDRLDYIDFIKIYIFFIIYDLIRNIFLTIIHKFSNYFGLNKKISLDLIILTLVNISLFYLFYSIKSKSFLLNIIIIFRIIFSLTNVSSLFISKIASNIFPTKERFSKLNIFDFYEKLNNFLIFVFIFFFVNTFDKFYLYFFCSSIFNLCFCLLYIIMFKCHDEKSYSLYEEQELNKLKSIQKSQIQNNKKNLKISKNKIQNIKGAYTIGEENILSKSNNKDTFNSKFKRNSSGIIATDNLVKSNINGYENKNINDNENNDIIYSSNNNQIITNLDIIKNNSENLRYQNKGIYMNNFQLASSNRSLNENFPKRHSFSEIKIDNILIKKKWKYISLILIPFKFLKYLFLFMLFLKTYSLKKVFEIKTHLIFYCCYFLMNIIIYPFNKIIFSQIKRKKKKIIMYTALIIFSIPSCVGYIYLILDNQTNKKYQLEKYILFFVFNFILKENSYILLRVYYINSISVGFNKKMFNDMKEISNMFTCILFLIYNILLLFANDTNIKKAIINGINYFIPISFLLIFFINTINIS